MRKVIVLEFVSLDEVIQAPGGPEEDTRTGDRVSAAVNARTVPL